MEPGGRVVIGLGSTVTALEALAADRVNIMYFYCFFLLFCMLLLLFIPDGFILYMLFIMLCILCISYTNLYILYQVRAWAFKYMTDLFEREGLTAILNPTLGVEVPVLSEDAKLRGESNTALVVKMMKHIFIANLLGLPGYNVPVGFVPAAADPALKLPVGLCLLGNHWEDHKVISILNALYVVQCVH